MRNCRIVDCVLIAGLMSLAFAQEQSPQAVEQKDLEIYNLKAELDYVKQELKKLQEYNTILRDSLQSKIDTLHTKPVRSEDANLRIYHKTIEDDHKLAEDIITDIRATTPKETPSVPSAANFMDDSTFTKKYNEALNQYFERNYSAAATSFEKLLKARLDHPLSDNCQYWLGECYYSREKFQEAIPIFQKVKQLGDGNKADAAQFKIGLSYLKLGRRSEALKAFKDLEANFPNSELVSKARQYYQYQEKF